MFLESAPWKCFSFELAGLEVKKRWSGILGTHRGDVKDSRQKEWEVEPLHCKWTVIQTQTSCLKDQITEVYVQ